MEGLVDVLSQGEERGESQMCIDRICGHLIGRNLCGRNLAWRNLAGRDLALGDLVWGHLSSRNQVWREMSSGWNVS